MASVRACLTLLASLQDAGLSDVVVCPGSRSGPLAVAASLLETRGLRLKTALDERSAGFFALGLGRASGAPAAVITTSGSAVAQLLPACVEADHGGIPLLLLSADRPDRLKGCGANQSVNQEQFLRASCRWFAQADGAGLAAMDAAAIAAMAEQALRQARGGGGLPPGAVHLNLPLEEPLHASAAELQRLIDALGPPAQAAQSPRGPDSRAVVQRDPAPGPSGRMQGATAGPPGRADAAPAAESGGAAASRRQTQGENAGPCSGAAMATDDSAGGGADRARVQRQGTGGSASAAALGCGSGPSQPASPREQPPRLDPDRPGVIVAGPWRGSLAERGALVAALAAWQRRCGWPVLADALSSLRGSPDLAVIAGYDLILQHPAPDLAPSQVLRLGPLPASRRLQDWLQQLQALQGLVTEGEARPLDPLRRCAWQWSEGLPAWLAAQTLAPHGAPAAANLELARRWQRAEAAVQALLDAQLPACSGASAAPPEAGPVLAGAPSALGHADSRWQDLEAKTDPEAPPAAAAAPEAGHRRGSSRTDAAPAEPPAERASPSAATVARGPEGGGCSEPWLARQLARLLPAGLPLMLANSSPVRDWESFAPGEAPPRPLFSFRGASGIDGTLSLACGLAETLGELVLVSGDLALLHDSNGWLWRSQLRGRLSVVLIDNGGGGIFEQLPIRAGDAFDFGRLFAMPQPLDPLDLARLHGVPTARLQQPQALPERLQQLLNRPADQPLGLLAVTTAAGPDAALRRTLHQAAAARLQAADTRSLPTMAADAPFVSRLRP